MKNTRKADFKTQLHYHSHKFHHLRKIMTNLNPSAPILVTGATGYIASWVIKNLLEQGHQVHATVRDLNKTHSFQHLTDIAANSTGSLQLFQAN